LSYLSGVHHIAVICSDYERSKKFYTEVLGLRVIRENYREQRKSYKLDLELPDGKQIELFSFPNPPARVSRPEACGLRHLALATPNLDKMIAHLVRHHVEIEDVRVDEFTGKRFTFFADPDGLPLEIYEVHE
jgi:glyoxylase I family protein